MLGRSKDTGARKNIDLKIWLVGYKFKGTLIDSPLRGNFLK